jgi:hypothetical protein
LERWVCGGGEGMQTRGVGVQLQVFEWEDVGGEQRRAGPSGSYTQRQDPGRICRGVETARRAARRQRPAQPHDAPTHGPRLRRTHREAGPQGPPGSHGVRRRRAAAPPLPSSAGSASHNLGPPAGGPAWSSSARSPSLPALAQLEFREVACARVQHAGRDVIGRRSCAHLAAAAGSLASAKLHALRSCCASAPAAASIRTRRPQPQRSSCAAQRAREPKRVSFASAGG